MDQFFSATLSDCAIIAGLLRNGKQNQRQLEHATGLTNSGVRKVLERLLHGHNIQFLKREDSSSGYGRSSSVYELTDKEAAIDYVAKQLERACNPYSSLDARVMFHMILCGKIGRSSNRCSNAFITSGRSSQQDNHNTIV
jgi:predicted transcriptional regulator